MEIPAKSGDFPNRLAQTLQELVHVDVVGSAVKSSLMSEERQHSLQYVAVRLQIPVICNDC